MAQILFGKPVKEKIKESLTMRVSALGYTPKLVILQVGDREDSAIYIRNKIKFGEEIGAHVEHLKFEETILEKDLLAQIEKLNADKNVNGIIVQLPLPPHLNAEKVTRSVIAAKDVDGLGYQKPEDISIIPATTRAILEILNFYGLEIKNKKVAIIGRSRLVGAPTAEMMKREGGLVSVCHRQTSNIEEVCKSSDILVSAAGQPKLVGPDFVNQDQTIIDVGINTIIPLTPTRLTGGQVTSKGEIPKKQIVGDVDFDEVQPIVKKITPVPGGVGVVTVACLFMNLLDAAEAHMV